MDKLVEGPFGSNACYEQVFEQQGQTITTWLCFGSGFTTSTLMTKGSESVKAALESSPELYKALMHTDKEGKVWFPATISLPNKGMVFADGTSNKSWEWKAVKAVPLQKGDKKITEDQTHRMDMKNAQAFPQNDFMTALEVIGFYEYAMN